MVYTKQQLIDAFCEHRGCEPSELLAIEAEIQARIDSNIAEAQAKVDAIEPSARKRMKFLALKHLKKQINKAANLQVDSDNANVNL